ncbi:MAG: 4'-phosphopantetheinyl transferase superfamily protein [Pseudomonadota bacterium]
MLRKQIEDEGPQITASTFLTDVEKEKFFLFRYDKRKVEWLGGRIAAKYAVLQIIEAKRTVFTPSGDFLQLEIAADQAGKPFVTGREIVSIDKQVHLSISHSGQWAAAIAAPVSCGIDIQLVNPTIERVKGRFINSAENAMVEALHEIYGNQIALTSVWAAKEAVKKASCGQSLPGFNEIGITALQKDGNGFIVTAVVTGKKGEKENAVMVWLEMLEGGVLAFTLADEDENEKNQ